MQTIQFIDGDGNKRFLKGRQMQGPYFGLEGSGGFESLYLAEGLATGVSVWQALERRAEVRDLFQRRELVTCGCGLRPEMS